MVQVTVIQHPKAHCRWSIGLAGKAVL